ncbi:MAG: hypothetical protein WB773_23295, partial [Isosphaeraceae bacterium]
MDGPNNLRHGHRRRAEDLRPQDANSPAGPDCPGSLRNDTRPSSGYWRTSATLADYCRVRSTARNKGLHAIDAIQAALPG